MKDKEINAFHTRLLDHFDGSYEGEIRTYLGCEIEVTWKKGLLLLVRSTMLRKFYALMTAAWYCHLSSTVLTSN